MTVTSKSVEIKCRRCGKVAKAEDFVLDYVYKMAVCPSCVKDRKISESKTLKQSLKEESKVPIQEQLKKDNPPGWDAEDEYLEKLTRQKEKGMNASAQNNYQTSGYNKQQPSSYPAQRQSVSQNSSPQQNKPMDITSFGMRSSSKPVEQPHKEQSPNKPLNVADFGMRQASKPVESHHEEHLVQEKHPSGSILGDRAEKANADPNKTKYKCKKCNYEFFYNIERAMPKACPYCNTLVNHLI